MAENGNVELMDEEVEGGAAGALTTMKEDDQLVVWENVAKNAERMIAAKKRIWTAIVGIAKPGDWTVFSSKDSEGNKKQKAELGSAGALRIASMIGINFTNWSKERVTGTDEKGAWFRWDMECDACLGGRTIRVYGRAGSRDKFFGKERGEFKELYDVDEGNIKMAAWRGAQKEGVKALLGLHHIPPEELEAAGVKVEHAGSYAFKSKEEKAEGVQSVTVHLESARFVKEGKSAKGPWKLYSIKDAEGVEYGTFSESIFKAAQDSIAGKKQAVISWEPTERGGRNITSLNFMG